jgi:hypothetical protein
MMTEAETIYEMLDYKSSLTLFTSRENELAFSRQASLKVLPSLLSVKVVVYTE